MDAVVVTPQLDWRLSGFDLLSEHSGVTSHETPLRYSARMVQSTLLQAASHVRGRMSIRFGAKEHAACRRRAKLSAFGLHRDTSSPMKCPPPISKGEEKEGGLAKGGKGGVLLRGWNW